MIRYITLLLFIGIISGQDYDYGRLRSPYISPGFQIGTNFDKQYFWGIQLSGGLIIQSIQCDGKKIWGDLHDKILFKNLPDLITLLEKLLNDKNYCSILLQEISENFRHSDKSIEKSLDKTFNILN